jgi:LysR family transcriptional regulator, glycine cleavage system transcriptional activator
MKRPHDWRTWFDAANVKAGNIREELSFANSSLAYQAAIDGLGVAIAHLELIQDDTDAGRLRALHPLVVRTSDSYHLVGRESEIGRPEIADFRNWLLSETGIVRA